MVLIVDCYLDEAGGTGNFARQLGNIPWTSVRPTREKLPDIGEWSAVMITGSAACLPDRYEGNGLREGWTIELIAWIRKVVDADIPVLGVCFGHQIIGAAFGGGVRKADVPEVGFQRIHVVGSDPLLDGLRPSFLCFVSHEDEISEAGGLDVLAYSDACAIHAVRVPNRKVWGVQFHTEMLPEEAISVLEYRMHRHPELPIDRDAELRKREDSPSLAPILFGRFLELAGCIG